MMAGKWTEWKPMPSPDSCRSIEAPEGPGVYQLRNRITRQLIQFGISKYCQERMKSLFPKPYGRGTRNNEDKRKFVLKNWKLLEYRTIPTTTRKEAKEIEDRLKALNNHLFNT